MYCVVVAHFFEKKCVKNLEMGYKLFYLCSRNQEPMY